MAHNGIKEKSPLRSFSRKKMDRLIDNGNIRIAESISCGCSLKSFHDNVSNLAKPTKYKISQIWPLFRHEFVLPATANKLDRGNRPSSNFTARKGFIRSPSPPQQRKSPVFAGVSMQRDNYVEISATKFLEDDDQDTHQKTVSLQIDYDDSIPMGTVVCKAKGSPCCSDLLQYGVEARRDDQHVLERDDAILDKMLADGVVNSRRCSSRKRLGSTSPPRSDDLYAAVEREFKRLGILNEKEVGVQYGRNNGKVSVTSSPKSMKEQRKSESDHQSRIDSSEQTIEIDHQSMSTHCDHAHICRCDFGQADTTASSLLDHKRHECVDHHKRQNSHATADDIPPATIRISPNNVVESFVSLSNVLCKSHFASLIRKSEASIQRFTSYLIKAKQRVVFRENPSHTPHKHDITACLISAVMPKVKFQSSHHYKYGLQACISKVIFDHFDTHSYGGEVDVSEKINRQFMFLRAYYVLEALENCSGEQLMEINEEFQQFCHRKLEATKRRVGWVSRWPSKLLQAFLLALKDVWVAHKLAFAFEKPASVFFAKPRSPLDLEHMSPLVESESKHLNLSLARTSPRLSPYFHPSPNPKFDNASFMGVVQFSVFPGFLLKGEGVLHSIVYLQPTP